MNPYRDYGTALALNVAAGVLLFVILQSWEIALASAIALGSVVVTVDRTLSFRHIGLVRWSSQRGTSTDFRRCLEGCERTFHFLASWGGSLPSLSPHIEKTFLDKVEAGCHFRFLLLAPGSAGEKRRRETRGSWPSGQPETDLRWLLHIKQSLGPLGSRFRVAIYATEPIWAMVLIDGDRGIIGYYGRGVGRENPGLVARHRRNGRSFLDAFEMAYRGVWAESIELHDVAQFEALLHDNHARSRSGFVVALTGPAGGGKTTIARLLAQRGACVCARVTTTRARRDDDIDGQYEYVSSGVFNELADAGRFVCATSYAGHRYALRRDVIFGPVENEQVVLVDSIFEPSLMRERLGPQVVVVFVVPRHFATLRTRLADRSETTTAEQGDRLTEARRQARTAHTADYLVDTETSIAAATDLVARIIEGAGDAYRDYGNFDAPTLRHVRAPLVLSERPIFADAPVQDL